jgi:hypothetical protein
MSYRGAQGRSLAKVEHDVSPLRERAETQNNTLARSAQLATMP